MISFLIPVFNTDITALAKALHQQALHLQISFEIVIADDFSDDGYKVINQKLAALPHVVYEELPRNTGRQNIRRHLALKANYPMLLLIDGDSRIIRQNFVSLYLQPIGSGGVVVGGREYSKNKPAGCHKTLHWKYGSLRENRPGKTGFISNNFCISQKLFLSLPLPEMLTGYGHEDTWMGMQLRQQNVPVRYINNPVLHDGVEDAPVFLAKTEAALLNLLALVNVCGPVRISKEVTLFRWHRYISKMGLTGVVELIYRKKEKALLQNFSSCRPSLFLFDFYRLARLAILSRLAKD